MIFAYPITSAEASQTPRLSGYDPLSFAIVALRASSFLRCFRHEAARVELRDRWDESADSEGR